MGYIRHHAIIVTTWDEDKAKKAHEKALTLKTNVTEIILGSINSYYSFMIGPDGSKEGWSESEVGDVQRKEFIKWVNSQAYEDGSSAYSFIEIQYGDDNGENKIISNLSS